MILELRTLRLTEHEAEVLANKLEVIGAAYAELESEDIKRAKEERELARRAARR